MDLDDHLDHFRARVLQDALAEATADYWHRRADAFAAVGTPTADETARACRNHARLLAAHPLITADDLQNALQEQA
jgi:hypothetical protein